MRKLLILTLLVAAAGLTALAQTPTQTPTDDPSRIERPFAAGGMVQLDLSAGSYRIEGRQADAIVVRWRTKRADQKVRAKVETRGKEAWISLDGPSDNFHADIQLPARSDIDLDLSAGELTIREITGSKNVSAWAGEISIEVGDSAAYRRVDAAVRFGELDARPFNVTKGGLFRSLKWEGRGSYNLRARLFAGELKLLR
ncbi:MAG: hypothetical protein ACRD09_16075 [Vicinamibacterales bacterium]